MAAWCTIHIIFDVIFIYYVVFLYGLLYNIKSCTVIRRRHSMLPQFHEIGVVCVCVCSAHL